MRKYHSLHVTIISLLGLEPNYRCRVAECEGVNGSYHGAQSCDTNDDDCLSKPQLPSWYKETSIGPNDRCRRRVPTPGLSKQQVCGVGGTQFVEAVDGVEEQCGYDELVFDRTIMTDTLIEEYHLICGRYHYLFSVYLSQSYWHRSGLRTIYNSIYMLGLLFGSYIFGWISDSYGRMKALMLSVIAVALSGFLGYGFALVFDLLSYGLNPRAFCYGPLGLHFYAFLRFITGMGGIGCFMVCFVLAVEHVGFKVGLRL